MNSKVAYSSLEIHEIYFQISWGFFFHFLKFIFEVVELWHQFILKHHPIIK